MFYQFKDIAEWLECYECILPDKRVCIPKLRGLIIRLYVSQEDMNHRTLIEAYLACDLAATCLTQMQQEELFIRLNERM